MKFKRYLKPLIYTFIIFSLVVTHLGFGIYTIFWHWSNPNFIQWNQLEIKIPEALIAKYDDEDNKSGPLNLYLIGDPGETTISFSAIERNLTKDYPYKKIHKKLGHLVLEEVPCQHPKTKCKWFKTNIVGKKEVIYTEDIYLLDENHIISYFGTIDNRRHLIAVFKNLKFHKK